jgi:predicted metal-dependent hydrolase
MKNNIILNIFLIILSLFLANYLYKTHEDFSLRCIISDKDGNRYCVRDRQKLHMAADKLAIVSKKCSLLVEHLKKNHLEKESAKRLIENYNPKKIYETLPTSEYTAYSENKGEKLAFCLDTEKNSKGKLIDDNTLMYVALHELSHIASKSIGHTDEFWNNFKFLITESKKINIYNPIDYGKKSHRYCGMDITDNPYFDL